MLRYFILIIAVSSLAACAQQGERTTAPVSLKDSLTDEKLYVVQEDLPSAKSLISGREAMNDLVKLGNKDHADGTKSLISSPGETVESAAIKKLKIKTDNIKTLSFKGQDKPANMALWLKQNNILRGKLLDAEVSSWGIDPHAKNTDRYIAYLNINMKLVDIEGNEVIAEYRCYRDTSAVPVAEAPTKYALLKDDKALLKKLYNARTRECVDEITQKLS